MSRVVFLGPDGSYSHMAAQKIFLEKFEFVSMSDFNKVIKAVDADTYAVVPIENSLEGTVNAVLDMLIFEVDQFIINEFVLNINHRLFVRTGVEKKDIKVIVTHPQAYGQCRNYISKHFPDVTIELTDSTSRALNFLNAETAAIAGGHIERAGINILDGLHEIANNNTRFVVLSKSERFCAENNKITIVFESENKPGGLLKILEILSSYNLNMTKIESRPHKSALGRYMFIVDFTGNINNVSTHSALKKIKNACSYYKYLGNYSLIKQSK